MLQGQRIRYFKDRGLGISRTEDYELQGQRSTCARIEDYRYFKDRGLGIGKTED